MALPAMARALADEGIDVDVATTDDDGPGRRIAGAGDGRPAQRNGFHLFQFPKQTEFYKISLPLRKWLRSHAGDYAIVHIHAVFSFSTIAAARAARAHRRPYIIRPLGILNTWGMENRRRWIKSLSFRLLDKPLLDHAAAMHYTSEEERLQAEQLGLRSPGHVIPLGIDLTGSEHLPSAEIFGDAFPQTRGRDIVLFLSRLDPKKGLDLLLDAFALASRQNPNAHLVVAGSGAKEFTAAMQRRAVDLGLSGNITWAGHLDGDVKRSAFAAAKLFVLPSSSENFGIALLEAMAAGVPCISCTEVALAAEAAKSEAVAISDRSPKSFSECMIRLLNDAHERQRLSNAGRSLAGRDYSLGAMGGKLRRLYESILA